MMISGGLMNKLTFPGVLVQGRIRERVLANGRGMDYGNLFWIVLLPLLANSVLCVLAAMLFLPFVNYPKGDLLAGIFGLGSLWLSFSFGMHAFPYRKDALDFWSLAKKAAGNRNFLGLVGYPVAVVIYVYNLLRFVWIDAVYPVFLVYYTWRAFGAYP